MANQVEREVTERAKEFGELTVKLSLDVSDALTAIKAVERRAREAKRAVAEIGAGEAVIPLDSDLFQLPPSVLSQALAAVCSIDYDDVMGYVTRKMSEYDDYEDEAITEWTTDDLVAELSRREGVKWARVSDNQVHLSNGPGQALFIEEGAR